MGAALAGSKAVGHIRRAVACTLAVGVPAFSIGSVLKMSPCKTFMNRFLASSWLRSRASCGPSRHPRRGVVAVLEVFVLPGS